MKKWIIGLLSLSIIIVSGLYCFTILKPVFTESTDLSNININGIKLNQTFKPNSDYSVSKDSNYITYDHHKMGTFLVTVKKVKSM